MKKFLKNLTSVDVFLGIALVYFSLMMFALLY